MEEFCMPLGPRPKLPYHILGTDRRRNRRPRRLLLILRGRGRREASLEADRRARRCRRWGRHWGHRGRPGRQWRGRCVHHIGRSRRRLRSRRAATGFMLDKVSSKINMQGVPSALGLGWVDLYSWWSIVCPNLHGQMGILQDQPGSWARWWNIQIKVNPTQVHDHQPHPVDHSDLRISRR